MTNVENKSGSSFIYYLYAKKHKKSNQLKGGFTLVELVIVIAIIALLAGIAIPTVHSLINSSSTAVDNTNIHEIEMSIKTAYTQVKNNCFDYDTDATTDTLTVETALNASGLNPNEILVSKVTGNNFRYDSQGKIVTSGGTELTKDVAIKEVFSY